MGFLCPSGARGGQEDHASTGSAPAGFAAPPLHPWLHPTAPPGPRAATAWRSGWIRVRLHRLRSPSRTQAPARCGGCWFRTSERGNAPQGIHSLRRVTHSRPADAARRPPRPAVTTVGSGIRPSPSSPSRVAVATRPGWRWQLTCQLLNSASGAGMWSAMQRSFKSGQFPSIGEHWSTVERKDDAPACQSLQAATSASLCSTLQNLADIMIAHELLVCGQNHLVDRRAKVGCCTGLPRLLPIGHIDLVE